MNNTQGDGVNTLIFPTAQDLLGQNVGGVGYEETPLPLKVIRGKGWWALVFNLFCAGLVFFITRLILSVRVESAFVLTAVPLILVWVSILAVWKKLWVVVDEQSGKIFVDMIFSKKLIVYLQGGHFVKWSSVYQNRVINFKKWVEIVASKETKNPITFNASNKFSVAIGTKVFFQYRNDDEALSRSLRFEPEELKSQTLAYIAARVSNLGGSNDYSAFLRDKATLAKFVSGLFGGERRLSKFELDRGITIKDPELIESGLSDASEEILAKGAEADIYLDTLDRILRKEDQDGKKIGLKEATEAAQIAVGKITKVVHAYEGVPQGATVVALGGDAAIAVAEEKEESK